MFLELCNASSCGYNKVCVNNIDGYECVCPICSDIQSSSFVCGADGVTEANECLIKKKSCFRNLDVFLVSRKPCGTFKFSLLSIL